MHTLARNYRPAWCSMSLSEAFESLDNARAFYHAWICEVRRKIPADRLLEFDVTKDGWAPFCKFLDLPIPEDGQAFPNANQSTVFTDRMRTIKEECWRKMTLLFTFIIGGIIAVLVTGV